jgi:hypothetical protein
MRYRIQTEEIINYATEYLTKRYGSGDSVTERGNYIPVIAHIMASYNIDYRDISNNWPEFYLSDLIPMVKIKLREWVQESSVSQVNEHTRLLVELMADRALAKVIYETYLKHISSKG